MKGRIHRIAANRFIVHADEGTWTCRFAGKAKRERKNLLRLASVGDLVEFTPGAAGEGVIDEVLPRRSKLSRHDSLRPQFEQIIAANVDRLIVIHAVADPELSVLAVDRCLVMGEACGLDSALVINKTDLAPAQDAAIPWQKAGYPVVLTCAVTGRGLDEFRALLRGRICVLLGPSGVGKTTLLNALRPDLHLKTGEVSDRTGEGRHTTSWVELLEIEPGTFVIDTPGLEHFTLWGVTVENLSEQFPEFLKRIPDCKYRATCQHVREPKCAVLDAVASGAIARARYDSYLHIREDLLKKRRELS